MLETLISDAFLIDPEPYEDERGFFSRIFCSEEFAKKGLSPLIVQINNSKSRSAKTLRGLHYQLPPFEETKLVRCIHGSLFDVVLDIRENSPTYGRWIGEILSSHNRRMMYVPKGCAHGFMTLTEDTEVIYFVSEAYSQSHERGIRYNDSAFNIQWPYEAEVISERDKTHPDFIKEQ